MDQRDIGGRGPGHPDDVAKITGAQPDLDTINERPHAGACNLLGAVERPGVRCAADDRSSKRVTARLRETRGQRQQIRRLA